MSISEKSLAQSALIITGAIAVSRILGLVRESIIAHEFGTSAEYDAFLVAFLIPHLLRMLLAEGALSAAFVPLFSEYLHKGRDLAYRFASNVLVVSLLVFPIVILLGVWLGPKYIPFLADGFNPEKIKLTAELTRITMPFIMLMGMAAILMGIHNSQENYFAPAFASIFFNVGMIIGGWWIAPYVQPHIMGLAWGVLIGGAGQLLFQLPFLNGYFKFRPVLDLGDQGLQRLAGLMLPTVLGLVVVELNMLVDYKLGSRLGDGQIASMQYAIRIFQLPLGLFAVALATALFTHLSRCATPDKRDDFVATLRNGLCLGALILFPAAMGMIALGMPVVSLLFEHGRFGPEDTLRTFSVLRLLGLALIGYGMSLLLARAYYALQDTRTPVFVSAVAFVVNIALALVLVGPLSIQGLTLATAVAGLTQMVLLAVILQRKLKIPFISQIAPVLAKILLFAVVMGGVVYLLDGALVAAQMGVFIRVVAGMLTGTLVYGLLAWRSGLLEEFFEPLSAKIEQVLGRVPKPRARITGEKPLHE
jgi:putative peptidoglycan lipid II flippase